VELTVRNWIAAAVLGTVFLGVVFRPAPQPGRFQMNSALRQRMERDQLVGRLRTLDRRLEARRSADSIQAVVRTVRSGADPVFDSRIPVAQREAIARRAHALPALVPGTVERVAFVVTIADRSDVSRLRGYLLYILPDRGASDRCVVVLRVPVRHIERMTVVQRDAATTSMLRTGIPGFPKVEDLGPCGFYAAFGPPSAQVARTLSAQGWLVASSGYSPQARLPDSLWAATPFARQMFGVYERADGIIACAAGRLEACAAGVLGAGFDPTARFGPGGVLAPPTDVFASQRAAVWRGNATLRARFLDHLARSLGPEKFARVWRGPSELPAAYASVAGEPFAVYVRRWLRRSIGPTYVGAIVVPRFVLMGLATMAAALAAAAAIHVRRGVA